MTVVELTTVRLRKDELLNLPKSGQFPVRSLDVTEDHQFGVDVTDEHGGEQRLGTRLEFENDENCKFQFENYRFRVVCSNTTQIPHMFYNDISMDQYILEA